MNVKQYRSGIIWTIFEKFQKRIAGYCLKKASKKKGKNFKSYSLANFWQQIYLLNIETTYLKRGDEELAPVVAVTRVREYGRLQVHVAGSVYVADRGERTPVRRP